MLSSICLFIALILAAGSPFSYARADATAACFASLGAELVTLQACDTALGAATEAPVERAQIHSAVAMLHARQGDLAAARGAMNDALAITVEDWVVQGNLGSLLIREGNYASAIAAFNTALAVQPNSQASAVLYLNRSLAQRALGRYDEAASDYTRYLTFAGLATAVPVMGPAQEKSLQPQHQAPVQYADPATP